MKKTLGVMSILTPTVLTIFIINFLFDIVSIKIQGLPIVIPFILCPIGAALGFTEYYINRDKISSVGLFFNIILLVFPILYNIIGALIQGP